MQTIILHGSVNAAFACTDFISLYVALEVISIAAFLLIAYPRTDRAIWVGLRYLFTSNVAMLFYLVGAAAGLQSHHSFAFAGLREAPPEALALIFLGLLVKGGIFVSGIMAAVNPFRVGNALYRQCCRVLLSKRGFCHWCAAPC
jgi:multicomponent Na+:H+ antiporter subunit D